MRLETQRLTLRLFVVDDAPALFRTVGDREVTTYWSTGPDLSIEQTCCRIQGFESHWKTHGFGIFAVVEKSTDALIGYCGLSTTSRIPQIIVDYALEKLKWGFGYATEALEAVLSHFAPPIVAAIVNPQNKATIRVLEKCGFRHDRDTVFNHLSRSVYLRVIRGSL